MIPNLLYYYYYDDYDYDYDYDYCYYYYYYYYHYYYYSCRALHSARPSGSRCGRASGRGGGSWSTPMRP